LVKPDEVSGGPQATGRLAVDSKKIIFGINQCQLKKAALLLFSKTGRANLAKSEERPVGSDERESSCYTMGARRLRHTRVAEYMAASKEDKEIIKGSRYLLLKNSENLHEEEKSKLNKILAINKNITTTLILKDLLKKLWSYRRADKAGEFLEYWCQLALDSGIKHLKSFVKTLQTHAHGILSHCLYPIHTSIIEGFNNKIKLIKRKAYGFNDMEYFTLVVKEAFFSN